MKWYILLLALLWSLARTSRGDEEEEYKSCIQNCIKSRLCSTNPYTSKGLPIHLRLLGWNCQSNCMYDCMWYMVETKRMAGHQVFQYHGKWPFVRMLGFQELASVVFSAANAWAHWIGYRDFRRSLGKSGLRSFYLSFHYKLYFFASIIAWIAACMFHTRDVPWTEHADYLTAITSVFIALYNAVLRHAYVIRRKIQLLFAIPFAVLLAYHLHHMLFIKFDYGWNMTLLACMFGIFAGIWLVWGLGNARWNVQGKLAIVWVIGAGLCGMLEIFDFEPIWDLVDAHALWHAGTVPLVLIIWKIYTLDAQEILKHPERTKGHLTS